MTIATSTPIGTDARSVIGALLQQYGLDSLQNWVWDEITAGATADQVALDMYTTPQFKARFPGIFERQAKGLPPISPGDYVNYEDSLRQLESQYNITPGVLAGTDQVAKFIGGDTSIQEVQSRVQNVYSAVNSYPPEVQQFWQQNYGHGSLLSWALDEKVALPKLEQQATAAQIGGTAAIGGVQIAGNTALQLAQMGVTQAQAQTQVQNLQQTQDLFHSNVTENQNLTAGKEGIEAAFGLNPVSEEELAQREAQRRADFAGGGAAYSDQYGARGAGAAKTA